MPTLQAIRRHLANFPALGYQQVTSINGLATGADAQRTIVTTDLASQVRSGSAQGTSGSALDDVYAYLLTATPQQRQVVKNGLNSSNVAGDVTNLTGDTRQAATVLLNNNLSAVLPISTVVELHPRCPVLPDAFVAGLHWCINKALNVMRWTDTLTVTGTGALTVSLASYPITQEAQVGGVYKPAASSSAARVPYGAGRGSLRFDGDTVALDLPYALASGATLEVDIYRPLGSWIKVSGVWATSTTGLVNETDECMGDLNIISMVAYYWVCSILQARSPQPGGEPWATEAKIAAIAAAPFMEWAQPTLRGPAYNDGNFMGDSDAYLRSRGGYGNGGGGGWP